MAEQKKTKFKLINKQSLEQIEQGSQLVSADYTIPLKSADGQIFVAQFDSVEENDKFKLENKVYNLIQKNGRINPEKAEIQNNEILENSSLGKIVKNQIDLFFNNLHVYDELGIKNKKRGMLLHSKPGCGKSLQISRAAQEYSKTKNACVLIWNSEKIDADDVRFFLTLSCDWSGIEKLLLIVEDLGGALDVGVHRNEVESSLLNFLDGIDVVFEKPTYIISTTNNPDSQLASLTSRPGRFDLVIKVPELTEEEKISFYSFFSKGYWNDINSKFYPELLKLSKKFQVAHIKETVIRARLEMTITGESFATQLFQAAEEIQKWIAKQEAGELSAPDGKRSLGFEQ